MRRTLVLNLAVFCLLFGLHIVFAARGMDLFFSLVAVFISLQVLLFGPLTVVLEGARLRTHRRQTNRMSSLVVVGLTVLFHGMLDRQLSVRA